jgi:peptidoglycan-N-acetylglucosamine deacetylase
VLNPIVLLFPSITWRIATTEKIIFLTFDDGPVPEATPGVLDLLRERNAKATFFCIGENVVKHPEIFRRILNEGHAAGNHTYNHLNGWITPRETFTANAELCRAAISAAAPGAQMSVLFRPPFGKLKRGQYADIKKDYKIVLWDVLTRDWEQDRSADSCFARVSRKASPGSIVVFHDSIKAKPRMLSALEQTLEHFTRLDYRFESLANFA